MPSPTPALHWLHLALAGVSASAAVLLALWGYLRLGFRAARPVARATQPPDARKIAREAREGFLAARGRVWRGLARGSLLPLAYAVAIALAGGGVFAAAAWNRLPDFKPTPADWAALPRLARLGLEFVGVGWMVCLLVTIAFHFRVVQKAREGSMLPWKKVAEEFDRAVGAAGVVATSFLGAAAGVLLAGWLVLWGIAGAEIARRLGLSERLGAAVALALSVATLWILVGVPLMFTFAILTRRDPGWLSAMEASVGLLRNRRRTVVGAAARVTPMMLSVFFWPAAAWILLRIVDDDAALVSVLLRERRPEDVLRELEQAGHTQDAALADAYRLIEAGRYLDGLNALQMYVFKNPFSAPALEGIAWAQLLIGNLPKAREAIERLMSLDPSNPRSAQWMAEIADGLWRPGGLLHEQARARCTQVLGAGLTNMDMIAKD